MKPSALPDFDLVFISGQPTYNVTIVMVYDITKTWETLTLSRLSNSCKRDTIMRASILWALSLSADGCYGSRHLTHQQVTL